MRRSISLGFFALISALLSAVPQAKAGDFTGAYAGVNVGYGFERGRDAKKHRAEPQRNAIAAPSDDLPPSAATAARALQQARPAAAR